MPPTSKFEDVLRERFHRRSILGGLMKAVPAAALMGSRPAAAQQPAAKRDGPSPRQARRDNRIQFTAIAGNTQDRIAVADGYRSSVLLKWGDPLFTDSPAFDPENQTAAAQSRQLGYNCDWMDILPAPRARREEPESWPARRES